MERNDPILRKSMPELDSIRGLAILMVVFYHGFFWSHGLDGLSGLAPWFVYPCKIAYLHF